MAHPADVPIGVAVALVGVVALTDWRGLVTRVVAWATPEEDPLGGRRRRAYDRDREQRRLTFSLRWLGGSLFVLAGAMIVLLR